MRNTRFLSFDGPIICIYLRTSNRHFRDQGKVRHPTSKLLKCDLVQKLNTFWNPSSWILAAGKASLSIVSKDTYVQIIIIVLFLKTMKETG